MRGLYKFKYKIYKKFQSDIWGLIILKNKKNNLFKFILKNFNYLLRKFYKNNYYKQNNIFFKKNILSNPNLKFLKIFSKFKKFGSYKFNRLAIYNKLNPFLIKTIYKLFWLKYFNLYYYFNKKNINNIFLPVKNTNYFLSINFFTIYFFKKLFINNKRKRYLYSRFKFNKYKILPKKSIYYHIYVDQFPKKNLFFRKKKSLWWNMKIEQSKVNVFFGFFNKQKFLKFQEYCFFSNKLRFYWILKVVGRLNFVIFNFNFYNNMYYIYNFIKKGNVMVNNKIIINPNYSVKLFDNISIINSQFEKIYFLLKLRLRNRNIFFNMPKYFEFNYFILTGSIWRYPLIHEIIGPYDFPFKTFSLDWLIYYRKFT